MVDLTTMSLSDKKRLARKLVEESDWRESDKAGAIRIIEAAAPDNDEIQAVELLIKNPKVSNPVFSMMASMW